MKQLPVAITDPIFEEPLEYSRYDRFWLQYINDKRDLPFIYLLTKINLVIVPSAIILYTSLLQGFWWWLMLLPYFYMSQIYLRGPFGLMLHNISHRRLFKKTNANKLNKYVIWFICPLFGHTPETYFGHHIGMHHVENNLPDDTSSTMRYKRDSIIDFFKYYFRFCIAGFSETLIYLVKRKKKKYYVPFSSGEISFYIFCIVMCFINFKATLWVFIIPCIFSRLVMMLGNWTQHAFVDINDPTNLYTNTYNCINTKYNRKCWNDGYHLIHHIKPGAHYTEMSKLFLKEKNNIAKNQSLVFDGIHYLHLFYYLMTKRYDKMVANLVNINGSFSSEKEALEVLKQRTQKVHGKLTSAMFIGEVKQPLL